MLRNQTIKYLKIFYISIRQIAILYRRLIMDKYYQDPNTKQIFDDLNETIKQKDIIDKELENKLNIPSKYRKYMVLLQVLRILLFLLIALTIISLFLGTK